MLSVRIGRPRPPALTSTSGAADAACARPILRDRQPGDGLGGGLAACLGAAALFDLGTATEPWYRHHPVRDFTEGALVEAGPERCTSST